MEFQKIVVANPIVEMDGEKPRSPLPDRKLETPRALFSFLCFVAIHESMPRFWVFGPACAWLIVWMGFAWELFRCTVVVDR